VSTNISQQHRSVRDLVQVEQASNPSTSEPSPIPSGHSSPTPDSFLPKSRKPKSLRPFIAAIMAFEKGRKFSTGTSVHRKRQMSTLVEKEGHFGPALTVCANCFFEHAPFPPQVLLPLVSYDQRPRGLVFHLPQGLERSDLFCAPRSAYYCQTANLTIPLDALSWYLCCVLR